jgi:hypothetical protein
MRLSYLVELLLSPPPKRLLWQLRRTVAQSKLVSERRVEGARATMLDAIVDVLPAGSAVCRDSLEYREMGVFRQAMNLPARIGPAR